MSAPNCADCHGFHDIKRKTDPASRIFRTTVPETCGNCDNCLNPPGVADATAGLLRLHADRMRRAGREQHLRQRFSAAHPWRMITTWVLVLLASVGTGNAEIITSAILVIGFVFDAFLEIFLVRTGLYIYSHVIPWGSFAGASARRRRRAVSSGEK